MDANEKPRKEILKVTLDASYEPQNYFEEAVTTACPDYSASIEDGRIVVTLRDVEPLPDAARKAAIGLDVRRAFQAHAVLTGRAAKLKELTLIEYHASGRDVSASAATAVSFAAAIAPGVLQTDSQGNVSRDPTAERLARDREFHDRCWRHRDDPVLQSLLGSFEAAVADPKALMHHLYEIRDALMKHFHGKKEAEKALGISHGDWSEFGRITNEEPIQGSRHRGKHLDPRPATEEEKSRVLQIARQMIEAYLAWLDRPSTASQ